VSKIRWLHISDLHYGYDSYVTIEMRTKMITSLPNDVIKDMGCPEYLFITGDLRHGKIMPEFPNEIVSDITKLMNAFNIPSNRVHIVMGNHDVERDSTRKDIAPKLRDEYATTGNLDESRMKTLAQTHSKFYEIYKAICNRNPLPYHTLVKETDFNIICLNTAFSCSDDNDDGKLIVGMKLVQETLKDMDTSKPGIVLAHHGFMSLQYSDRENLENKLKEKGVLLYLCGHEHLGNCRNINDRRENQPLLEYVCGTGMDKFSTGKSAEMVVFVGELDTELKCGYIKAWEWRARSNAWLPYSDISYKQTGLSDGCHYFPQTPSHKLIVPTLRAEVVKKYRDYLSFECGEIRLDGMPADDKVGSKTLELEKLFIPIKLDRVSNRKYNEIFSPFDFDSKIDKARAESFSSFIQCITDHLEQLENELWSNYDTYLLFKIEHTMRKVDSYFERIDECSQEKIKTIHSQVRLLKDNLQEKMSVIPSKQSGFRRVILAGPGGGKTTLLKRLTMAYAFPERRKDPEIDDDLPDRTLFPIWIRCRDLKEKAALSLTEIIKSIPSAIDFQADRPELTSAFIAEVFERIKKGESLLLIDGLDEIADAGIRKIFAKNIVQFARSNPEVNIIVTSRISGFDYVSDGELGEFPRLHISKLNVADIRRLCRRWHKIIYGDQKEILEQADALTAEIERHRSILALAISPLLLTTLLLVQRRVGRLPTRRNVLYEESIKVLLETWNQQGFPRIDLETAKCQLAYVAFVMMQSGIQTIGWNELLKLINVVREEQSWLPSGLESPQSFLERVDLRSSLLTKCGYRQTDMGVLEAEYEFQHLTFQEYLAAFAVVNGYYSGADQKHNYLDALENFYDDANKKEVVLFATAQVNRKCVTDIVNLIINRINNFDRMKKDTENKIVTLRNLLTQIMLDEVQLVEETRQQIFETILFDTIWQRQAPFFRDLLKSPFSEEFRVHIKTAKRDALLSALELQAQEEKDPIDKCVNLIMAGGNGSEEQKYAVNTFNYLLWVMDSNDVRTRLEKVDYLKLVLDVLVSIVMKSNDGQEIRNAASCIDSFFFTDCEVPPECIPHGFIQKVLYSIYEGKKITPIINLFTRLVNTFLVNSETAQRLLYFSCSNEIKKFLSDNLPTLPYHQKKGAFWAAVCTGTWDWGEAEEILEKTFAEEDAKTRDKMLEKLSILRASAENTLQ